MTRFCGARGIWRRTTQANEKPRQFPGGARIGHEGPKNAAAAIGVSMPKGKTPDGNRRGELKGDTKEAPSKGERRAILRHPSKQ